MVTKVAQSKPAPTEIELVPKDTDTKGEGSAPPPGGVSSRAAAGGPNLTRAPSSRAGRAAPASRRAGGRAAEFPNIGRAVVDASVNIGRDEPHEMLTRRATQVMNTPPVGASPRKLCMVTRGDDGRLRADDVAMQCLLDKATFDGALDQGVELHLAGTRESYDAFSKACEFIDSESNNHDAKMIILMRVLHEGSAALPSNSAIAESLRQVATNSIQCLHGGVQSAISTGLANNAEMALMLGASMVLGDLRRIEFDWKNPAVPVALSMGATAAVAAGQQYGISNPIQRAKLGQVATPTSAALSRAQRAGLVLGDAAAAFAPEVIDAMIVGKFVDMLGDGKLEMPSFDDVKDGVKSGLIATLATIPDALVKWLSPQDAQGAKHGALTFTDAIVKQVATFGCGAMVPLKLNEERERLDGTIVAAVKEGIMNPLPAGAAGASSYDVVKALREDVMGATKEAELMEKSLGIALVVGLVPWLCKTVGVDESVQNVLERTLFNPIEVLSLTGAQTLERFVGGKDGYFTTDRRKADQLADFALLPPAGPQEPRARLENILHPMASKASLTAGRWVNVAISAPLTAVANRIFGAATHEYEAATSGPTQT